MSVNIWVKISTTMHLKKKARIWKPEMNMNAYIIEFNELYVHGPNKKWLEKRDTFLRNSST